MSTNDIKIIREALEEAKAIDERDNPSDPSLYTHQLQQALAALDRLEAQQPDIAKLIEAVTLMEAYEQAGGDNWWKAWDAVKYAAKSAAPAQQQPERLTDEEIVKISIRFANEFDGGLNRLGPKANCAGLISAALEHARDNGYIGGLSVEDATEVAYGHTSKWLDKTLSEAYKSELRASLTAKLNNR